MKSSKKSRIILASGSPRRKEIMERFGYEPVIIVSGFDEEAIKENNPRKLVSGLSKGKAEEVRTKCMSGDTIVAADTIVVCDGEILGKPKTKKEAVQMLQKIRGRKHEVYTGVTIIKCKSKEDETITFTEKTSVKIMDIEHLTNCRIHSYVDSGEPMDKAGSYAVQGKFGRYIEAINGDLYNVIGLPVKTFNYL